MLLTGFPDLAALVERRIEEARARGDFDDLPGAGRPLDLDDDPLVPEEMRIAHRILKNSGFAPPELQELAEINRLIAHIERDEIAPLDDSAGTRRLRALLIQLESSGREATARCAWMRYQEALIARLGRS
jgi:hypothetical protein